MLSTSLLHKLVCRICRISEKKGRERGEENEKRGKGGQEKGEINRKTIEKNETKMNC